MSITGNSKTQSPQIRQQKALATHAVLLSHVQFASPQYCGNVVYTQTHAVAIRGGRLHAAVSPLPSHHARITHKGVVRALQQQKLYEDILFMYSMISSLNCLRRFDCAARVRWCCKGPLVL